MNEAIAVANPAQWLTAIAVSVTALMALASLIIGLARKPFKELQAVVETAVDSAVSAIKADADDLRKGISDIGSTLRNHEEALREIQRGQKIIVESLKEVLPPATQGVLSASVPDPISFQEHMLRLSGESSQR